MSERWVEFEEPGIRAYVLPEERAIFESLWSKMGTFPEIARAENIDEHEVWARELTREEMRVLRNVLQRIINNGPNN